MVQDVDTWTTEFDEAEDAVPGGQVLLAPIPPLLQGHSRCFVRVMLGLALCLRYARMVSDPSSSPMHHRLPSRQVREWDNLESRLLVFEPLQLNLESGVCVSVPPWNSRDSGVPASETPWRNLGITTEIGRYRFIGFRLKSLVEWHSKPAALRRFFHVVAVSRLVAEQDSTQDNDEPSMVESCGPRIANTDWTTGRWTQLLDRTSWHSTGFSYPLWVRVIRWCSPNGVEFPFQSQGCLDMVHRGTRFGDPASKHCLGAAPSILPPADFDPVVAEFHYVPWIA